MLGRTERPPRATAPLPTMQDQAPSGTSHRWLDLSLVGLIAALLLAKLHLVFLLNLNWDEYNYLSNVYSYGWGTLSSPWQTFHAHLFGWLRAVPGYEIGQIFVGRTVAWVLSIGCALLTYALGRRFLGRTAALFAVLCYLSFCYLIEHGTSFRPDTLSAPMFLAALYLVSNRSSQRTTLAAGALLALSMMITIKSVLFAGVAGLVVLLARPRQGAGRAGWRREATLALTFLVTLAALWSWHRSGLVPAEPGAAGTYLKSSASKVFLTHGFFPRWHYFAKSLRLDALAWLLLATGASLAIRQAFSNRPELRRRALTLLVFALPLATLLIYRNAFPYYYVFILSPAVILCGVSLEALLEAARARGSRLLGLLATVLVLAVAGQGITHYLRNAYDQNLHQKALLETVHHMFPEPVPYVDRCAMVASFPKVGFFMSTWGIEKYRAAGRLVMADLLREEQPRFLIANVPSLYLFLPETTLARLRFSLLPEDREVLRRNFIPYWGLLYIAGKDLPLEEGAATSFEILVSGPYTVATDGSAELDGEAVSSGDVVQLAQGPHTATAVAGASRLILRWGEKLYRPSEPPPSRPLFIDF